MKVVVEGEQSKSVTVESGVPQGTVLRPLMFLCHINDLPDVVRSQVRLFADDCLLYRQIKSNEDHVLLQKDLTELEIWASRCLCVTNLGLWTRSHTPREEVYNGYVGEVK